MHRYQPRVHVVRSGQTESYKDAPFSTFAFPETVFISVTAYQNTRVSIILCAQCFFPHKIYLFGCSKLSYRPIESIVIISATPEE